MADAPGAVCCCPVWGRDGGAQAPAFRCKRPEADAPLTQVAQLEQARLRHTALLRQPRPSCFGLFMEPPSTPHRGCGGWQCARG